MSMAINYPEGLMNPVYHQDMDRSETWWISISHDRDLQPKTCQLTLKTANIVTNQLGDTQPENPVKQYRFITPGVSGIFALGN